MAELVMTDSRRLNHIVVTRPASSLVKDRESSPAETSILTTMLCHKANKHMFPHVLSDICTENSK